MKKRYLILTALLALSLAACSQEKAKTDEIEKLVKRLSSEVDKLLEIKE